jgi:hypothetical protein
MIIKIEYEVVVVCLKIVLRNSPGENEESHENFQSVMHITFLGFEQNTCH